MHAWRQRHQLQHQRQHQWWEQQRQIGSCNSTSTSRTTTMTTLSLSSSITLYAIRVRGMAWGGGLEQGWDARSQRVQPSDDNDVIVRPARARANNRAGAKGPVRTRAGTHRPA
jgi:hypothetical protein